MIVQVQNGHVVHLVGVLQVQGTYRYDKGKAVAIISKPGTDVAHAFLVTSPMVT